MHGMEWRPVALPEWSLKTGTTPTTRRGGGGVNKRLMCMSQALRLSNRPQIIHESSRALGATQRKRKVNYMFAVDYKPKQLSFIVSVYLLNVYCVYIHKAN